MNIKLRKTTINDCLLLFKWVNNEDVRNNSFNTNNVKYEDHVRWFKEKLNSNNTYIFILEKGNQQLGQIRIEIDNSKAIINYSIDKKHRGKGYGTDILYMLEQEILKNEFKVDVLEGNVKINNVPSQQCFEKNNYEKYIKNNYVQYRKNLNKQL